MKLNKIIIYFAAVILSINFAYGATVQCSEALANKTACLASELMHCNKEFNSNSKSYFYEWHALNDSGQPFEIYLNKNYKQTPGYIPAKCLDAKGEETTLTSKKQKTVDHI